MLHTLNGSVNHQKARVTSEITYKISKLKCQVLTERFVLHMHVEHRSQNNGKYRTRSSSTRVSLREPSELHNNKTLIITIKQLTLTQSSKHSQY